jgi:hypothetical protein
MPLASHQPVDESPRYTFAELVEMRRQLLRYARSFPPGSERNRHRQVELSIRRLFQSEAWLSTHTIKN